MAALIVLASAVPTAAQERPPIDHALAAEYFLEARALEAANPWAGTLYGPIMLVDPSSRYVVANRADSDGHLAPTGSVFTGILPDELGIANTATRWGGEVWTMLVWPLPHGRHARARLVGHELFHRLGPELGLPMASPTNAHLDTADGRSWFRLELRALVRAVAQAGPARRQAVEDALAFRARRWGLFPAARRQETALELNEGLAEYTGVHVSLPPGARAGWVVQQTEDREARARREGISRSFAYASGPPLGLLLDDAWPGWHERVNADTELSGLLAEAYDVDTTALEDRAADRMKEYGGPQLLAFEEQRERRRLEQEAEFRARYVEGSVLRLPVDEEFGYSFDPNGISSLEGVGQVLAGAEIRAGWGLLSVSGEVLLERADGGITGVVVSAPPDPGEPTVGDGWTLQLAPGWEIVPGRRDGDWVVRPEEPDASRRGRDRRAASYPRTGHHGAGEARDVS